MVATTFYLFMGNKPIIYAAHNSDEVNPIFFCVLLQCFLMQHLTCALQVNHVTKTKYSPFRNRMMIFNLVAVPTVYVVDTLSDYTVSVDMCIYLVFTITVVCQWHFVLNVVNEMSSALNIRIFCVKKMESEQKFSYDKIGIDGQEVQT